MGHLFSSTNTKTSSDEIERPNEMTLEVDDQFKVYIAIIFSGPTIDGWIHFAGSGAKQASENLIIKIWIFYG